MSATRARGTSPPAKVRKEWGHVIVRKSRAEIEKMRLAGQVVADVHKMLQDIVVPGVTTAELDKKAEALIRSRELLGPPGPS